MASITTRSASLDKIVPRKEAIIVEDYNLYARFGIQMDGDGLELGGKPAVEGAGNREAVELDLVRGPRRVLAGDEELEGLIVVRQAGVPRCSSGAAVQLVMLSKE